jgi:hypothetical protein
MFRLEHGRHCAVRFVVRKSTAGDTRELLLRNELKAEPESQRNEDQREHNARTACPSALSGFILQLPLAPARSLVLLYRRDE